LTCTHFSTYWKKVFSSLINTNSRIAELFSILDCLKRYECIDIISHVEDEITVSLTLTGLDNADALLAEKAKSKIGFVLKKEG